MNTRLNLYDSPSSAAACTEGIATGVYGVQHSELRHVAHENAW